MKINYINNKYQNRKNFLENNTLNFKSKPSGDFYTKIFRTDSDWNDSANFILNHLMKKINNPFYKIKVLSHFCSDCSELYSFILKLIKSLDYKTVYKKFMFEARDINPEIITEVKDKKIYLIKTTLNGKKNDIVRLEENIGEFIYLKEQKVGLNELFKPVEPENTDIFSDLFGFQKCSVNDNLANLVTAKQENIKDFSDHFDIIFLRNTLSDIFQSCSIESFRNILHKIYDHTNPMGIVMISKYDAEKFNIKEEFNNLFKNYYTGKKGDLFFIK